jgi:hypothetical protein
MGILRALCGEVAIYKAHYRISVHRRGVEDHHEVDADFERPEMEYRAVRDHHVMVSQ